jgi:hypothetical protein
MGPNSIIRRGAMVTLFDGLQRELQQIIEKLLITEKDTLKQQAPKHPHAKWLRFRQIFEIMMGTQPKTGLHCPLNSPIP